MAISTKPWNGSKSRWPTAQSYCKACLINENTGPVGGWTKDKCHLPVHEPGGALNVHGLAAAAAMIGKVKASASSIAGARRKLRSLYREAHMTPPPSLKN